LTEGGVDIDAVVDWVRSIIPSAGRLRSAHVEPWASVFKIHTSGNPVWFKACAPTHAFEVWLTASLASRWPNDVTEVLAFDIDRRWLLMADAGEPLRVYGNPPQVWERFLPVYAELQIGESRWVSEHLRNGVPDLRVERLPTLFEDLIHASLPIEVTEQDALSRLAPRFNDLCAALAAAGVEPSVQHDDLHMNNVYVGRGQLRALDWGDASIGHPFASLFEVFRFLSDVNRLARADPWFGRLRDAYLEPWGADRRSVFDVAHVVGGFAHAIAWLHQRLALPESDRPAFDEPFSRILRLAMSALPSAPSRL
jgi:hypothetical protein